MGALLYVIATFIFVLAALGVDVASQSPVELGFWGLAVFALAHVIDWLIARAR